MPVYNKLVRDKIPAIIEQSGGTCTTRVLSPEEYREALRMKAQEELAEYLAAPTDSDALEELADLLEVVHGLAKAHGATAEVVEKMRVRKKQERGGFDGRVLLLES